MSSGGHVRISPTILPFKYNSVGGEVDYRRLYDDVLAFVALLSARYPVHISNLLFLL
jgi:hypothetical protein